MSAEPVAPAETGLDGTTLAICRDLAGRLFPWDTNRALELAGFAALRPERAPFSLADGRPFDQDDPIAYLRALPFSAATAVEAVSLPATGGLRPLAAR